MGPRPVIEGQAEGQPELMSGCGVISSHVLIFPPSFKCDFFLLALISILKF